MLKYSEFGIRTVDKAWCLCESDGQKNLVRAYLEGYRITEEGDVISKTGTTLKPVVDSKGYKQFTACVPDSATKRMNKVRVWYHRLAGFQKFGLELFKHEVIRHLNNDSMDNTIKNIGIGSHADNAMDNPPEQRLKHAVNASKGTAKFNWEEKLAIRKYHAKSDSYARTMKKFGIKSKGSLHHILKNEYVIHSRKMPTLEELKQRNIWTRDPITWSSLCPMVYSMANENDLTATIFEYNDEPLEDYIYANRFYR